MNLRSLSEKNSRAEDSPILIGRGSETLGGLEPNELLFTDSVYCFKARQFRYFFYFLNNTRLDEIFLVL